jgi:hypothetical protein
MLRFFAGAGSALLAVIAGFFIWKGQAEADDPVPAPPQPRTQLTPLAQTQGVQQGQRLRPPEATEKSKEEKRFARADRNDDGRITVAELYEPRRKAFAKLDRNGNGSLSFEEWAGSTGEKFAKADADRSGWLSPREYETTKPKTKPKPKCRC